MKNNSMRKQIGGASANALVMPVAVVLAVFHVLIIALILMINSSSGKLSTVMKDAGTYTQDATSLLAGSSLLSETSSNYVLMPVTESGESGYSMAVLLFDINYLKTTNDTMGHLAGDKLIRDAAECIASCFGDGKESNCFRFGGDEFAAVVKNCTPETIRSKVERFQEAEKQHNVSISLGYAYAEEIGETTFKQLLDEADRQMYANKKAAHDAQA